MAGLRIQYQETPNPNAIKCVLDQAVPPLPGHDGPRSYASGSAAAAGDQLAMALLAVRGVTNVLIADRWVTVNRAPGADWKMIKQAVERIVREQVPSEKGPA